MLVKAKLLDLDRRQHKGKDVVDLTFKLTNPGESITVTLWNNSVVAGEDKAYEKMIGKIIEVPLQIRVWNGNLQYGLYSAPPTEAAA